MPMLCCDAAGDGTPGKTCRGCDGAHKWGEAGTPPYRLQPGNERHVKHMRIEQGCATKTHMTHCNQNPPLQLELPNCTATTPSVGLG